MFKKLIAIIILHTFCLTQLGLAALPQNLRQSSEGTSAEAVGSALGVPKLAIDERNAKADAKGNDDHSLLKAASPTLRSIIISLLLVALVPIIGRIAEHVEKNNSPPLRIEQPAQMPPKIELTPIKETLAAVKLTAVGMNGLYNANITEDNIHSTNEAWSAELRIRNITVRQGFFNNLHLRVSEPGKIGKKTNKKLRITITDDLGIDYLAIGGIPVIKKSHYVTDGKAKINIDGTAIVVDIPLKPTFTKDRKKLVWLQRGARWLDMDLSPDGFYKGHDGTNEARLIFQSSLVTAGATGSDTGQTDIDNSGIELTESVPYKSRLQFISFGLTDGHPVETAYEEIEKMRQTKPAYFNSMLKQMQQALRDSGVTEHRIGKKPNTIIRQFERFVIPRIRKIVAPLAIKYKLDPHATIVLEWGSRRPAHFHQRGKWEQKIILNINLLVDDVILEGEILHEILHPLVSSWAEYIHIENPDILEAAGIEVRKGVPKKVNYGYMASVWGWDFKRDAIKLLLEAIQTVNGSDDKTMQQEAVSTYEYLTGLLNIGTGLLEKQYPIKSGLDIIGLEDTLRKTLDSLETSDKFTSRLVARNIKIAVENKLQKIIEFMKVSQNRDVRRKAADLENTLNARSLKDALIEAYILKKELEFFDQNEKGSVVNTLASPENILDHKGRFTRLLRLGGTARLEAIIKHVSNKQLYFSKPELAIGASILLKVWKKNPETINNVLRAYDARFANQELLSELIAPIDMDELIDRITNYRVELIKIRFTDPNGKLKGQRKTVIMPVNDATFGILHRGISFDGSSVHSSIDGKPLRKIFRSDFVAEIIPDSLRIYKRNGRIMAQIDAAARTPSENPTHILKKEHLSAQAQRIARVEKNLEHSAAAQKAIDIIKSYGLPSVKLLINDWSEDVNLLTIESKKLRQAFDGGVELDDRNSMHLPTKATRKGFKAVADPYSLRLIRYEDNSIEAVMAVKILDNNGIIFDGDFRSKLAAIEQETKSKGFIPYMSPEPEVFLFRHIENGLLVTADTDAYYDDLRRLPQDVQHVLNGVITATESAGINLRYIHHEVSPGQFEMPYQHDTPVEAADTTTLYKYILKKVAKKYGLEACFMPKPVEGINGSGMHVHQSLVAIKDLNRDVFGKKYKEGENLFFDPNTKMKLSRTARYYINGLLKYAPGILRITNPDPNSYLRIVPHYEAPTNIIWGTRNRSALVRVPAFSDEKTARFEIRMPDSCGNIHAKFCAILLAGLTGIKEKIEPPDPLKRKESVFDMGETEKNNRNISELPGGPGGLEKAIELMNNPDMAPVIDRLLGKQGSPVREFLSQPIGVLDEAKASGNGEHMAVRQAAGLFDIGHMGVLEVKGPGAFNFLQRVTTNDVSKLKTGDVQYSFIADNFGHILDDVMVSRLADNRYMLVVNAANTEKIKSWLISLVQKDALKSGDYTVSDLRNSTLETDRKVMLAIQGPKSLDILQKLANTELSDIKYFTVREAELDGIKVLISRTGYTGERGCEIFVHPDEAQRLWEKLLKAGKEEGVMPCDLASRDSLRIEAGLPLYGHELAGAPETLPNGISPFEAGFGDFVAFDKGDFIGKNGLLTRKARADNRVVNLVITGKEYGRFDLDVKGMPIPTNAGENHPASIIFALTENGFWVEVGQITSRAVNVPTYGEDIIEAMALVHQDAAKAGTQLKIVTRGKECYAVVLPRDFYDNAGDKYSREYAPNYIPVTEKERGEMLTTVGVESMDKLFNEIMPQGTLFEGKMNLPSRLNRLQLFLHMLELSRKNRSIEHKPSFLGAGMYRRTIPPLVEAVLGERRFVTPYTAYQPEVMQGTLQAIYMFQSFICGLTGMEAANASMYDGGSALAEAALMAYRITSKGKNERKKIVVAGNINPFRRSVLNTYIKDAGIKVVEAPFDPKTGLVDIARLKGTVDDKTACVIVQQPNFFGCIETDLAEVSKLAHSKGALLVADVNLMSLTELAPPSEYGADIVTGEAQSFGNRLNFGGPGLGIIACKRTLKQKDDLLREMPGRIIGKTVDTEGRPGYVLTLGTREQHIRREKATSNICSNEALCAFAATAYMLAMGSDEALFSSGFLSRNLAEEAAERINEINGFNIAFNSGMYNEFVVESAMPIGELNVLLSKRGIVGGLDISSHTPEKGNFVLFTFTDITTRKDLDALINALQVISDDRKFLPKEKGKFNPEFTIEPRRYSEVFESLPHFDEETLQHFIDYLASMNFSIDKGFYPLGSCTMKYNPKTGEIVAGLPGFTELHPDQPIEDAQGTLELMYGFERALSEMFGFKKFTLQPAAGAHGELTGIKIIRAYHQKRGDENRNIIIAPNSSHGTNPASVAMAGFKPIEIKSDPQTGTIDLEELKRALDENEGRIAGIMITNPNTLGIFEKDIVEICRLIHEAGGLVYMDGANLNAIIGRARPGDWGIDVLHANLHKTFGTPHGGGGPGSGPVGVRADLVEFLPKPTVEFNAAKEIYYLNDNMPDSIGKMHTNFGNVGVIVRAYAYLRSLGFEGLKEVSGQAVLSANYMMEKLTDAYDLPYGESVRRMHEFVLAPTKEMEEKGGAKVTIDIAKFLIDKGFHPPTVFFPLIVDGALMIEPTETAYKKWMDGFSAAMIDAANKINSGDLAALQSAPTTTPVWRLDETKAARALDITTPDVAGLIEEALGIKDETTARGTGTASANGNMERYLPAEGAKGPRIVVVGSVVADTIAREEVFPLPSQIPDYMLSPEIKSELRDSGDKLWQPQPTRKTTQAYLDALPRYFREIERLDEREIQNRMSQLLQVKWGGPGFASAYALFKLGADVKFICMVGNDQLGKDFIEMMKREEMDISGVKIVQTDDGAIIPTSTNLIFSRQDGTTAYNITTETSNDFLTPNDVTDSDLKGTVALHFGGIALNKMFIKGAGSVIDRARAKNVKVGWDTVIDVHDLEKSKQAQDAMRKLDYFTPSMSEAPKITGLEAPKDNLSYFYQTLNIPLVFLKNGKDGCYIQAEAGYFHLPTVSGARQVDPTGAGDAFSAYAALGIALGLSPIDIAKGATVCGALAVEQYGGGGNMGPNLRQAFFEKMRPYEEAYLTVNAAARGIGQADIERLAAARAAKGTRAASIGEQRRRKADERAAVVIAADKEIWLNAERYLKNTGIRHVQRAINEDNAKLIAQKINEQTGIAPDLIKIIDTINQPTGNQADLQGLGHMDEETAITRLNEWLDTQKLVSEAASTGV